jgi:hypothetical protein
MAKFLPGDLVQYENLKMEIEYLLVLSVEQIVNQQEIYTAWYFDRGKKGPFHYFPNEAEYYAIVSRAE